MYVGVDDQASPLLPLRLTTCECRCPWHCVPPLTAEAARQRRAAKRKEWEEKVERGQRIVLDMAFHDLMHVRERRSTRQQVQCVPPIPPCAACCALLTFCQVLLRIGSAHGATLSVRLDGVWHGLRCF